MRANVSKSKSVMLKGLLVASDWNEDGLPVRLKLMASGEREYPVIECVNFEGLFKSIGRFIEVSGKVDRQGRDRLLKIEKFTYLHHLLDT